MMNMDSDSGKYDLGYVFYPPDHPSDPGHPRLDVFLRSQPTNRHFDPEQVDVPTVSTLGHIEKIRVQRPWPGPYECRVAPDFINIIDRVGKVVEAFIFGGEMRVHEEGDVSICTLTSPAPILGMLYRENIATVLAREVEILIAERRATWAQDQGNFERRLVATDPLTLYLACLKALDKKFSQLPHSSGMMQHLRFFLHNEPARMYQLHPLYSHVPDLSAIL